jgi:hypothetical protein
VGHLSRRAPEGHRRFKARFFVEDRFLAAGFFLAT